MAWEKMVSMELDDESKLDAMMPIAMSSKPDYPWGLRICLTHDELAKLGLASDCDVGDMIRFGAMATVTSVSKNEDSGGSTCRVELQIEKMGIDEG